MHDLFKDKNSASAAEQRVLAAAKIQTKLQQNGNVNIDPIVERELDRNKQQAGVDRAVGIARLYGLIPGFTALVPKRFLPKSSNKDAPEWEARARQRMHDLLRTEAGATVAEQFVLKQAEIPMVTQQDGRVTIDPTVARESGRRMASASGAPLPQPDVEPGSAWQEQPADTYAYMEPFPTSR